MKVLKFGGSSVGTPERIRGIRKIIESQTVPCVVVISAFFGVTDQLKQISQLAAQRNNSYKFLLNDLISQHKEIAGDIIENEKKEFVFSGIDILFNELAETLNGIYLLRELSRRALDQVLSYGEILSSSIISNLFDESLYIDSRSLIKTDDNFGNANVNFDQSNVTIREFITGEERLVIVPGFIASTVNNETTTLGRGGSDYTAAIIAAAINAELLEIWTDVDGFMTADPKKVEVILDTADTKMFMPRNKDNPRVEYLRSTLGIKKEALIVLYVGSFSALQGTDILLKAAKCVLEQEKNLFFVLAGGRWNRDYEYYIRTAENLGISSHVKFIPGVSYIRTLPYLVNLADVAVAPKRFSLQSHGKLAVLMASALPTVVFDNRINRLFLDSLGIYVKEVNAEVFAEAIISGMNETDNNNLREKLRERAVRYFSLQRLVNDMQRVYEKVAV